MDCRARAGGDRKLRGPCGGRLQVVGPAQGVTTGRGAQAELVGVRARGDRGAQGLRVVGDH
jgi:hypothetical protein